jgi:hypothetical protein
MGKGHRIINNYKFELRPDNTTILNSMSPIVIIVYQKLEGFVILYI